MSAGSRSPAASRKGFSGTAPRPAVACIPRRSCRAQVDAGLIEVAAEDIEPTAESVAPPDALEPEQLRQEYDDYRWLAGWEG